MTTYKGLTIEELQKAIAYQYPEALVLFGYEPAVYDAQGNLLSEPDNTVPRIDVWPLTEPKPTAAQVREWAAAYDAEQPTREAEKQARLQKRQAAKNAVKNFDRAGVKSLEDAVVLLEQIVELLNLD